MVKLLVFDVDQTLVVAPKFYRKWYSGSLNAVVEEMRGKTGLNVLQYCREQYRGKGELALFALNIPYSAWAEKLIRAPLDLVKPDLELVECVRAIKAHKVIYTGSPRQMAYRLLSQVGFTESDFELIVGWQEPEVFPVKWTCSSLAFQAILTRFNCTPQDAVSVGDDWSADLAPAKLLGMQTAQIGRPDKRADYAFPTISQLLECIGGQSGF